MTSMIERAARAIYEGRNGSGCKPWSRLTQAHREPYLADVRAAIEAMRDPTDAMIDIGVDGDDAVDIYQSMLDTALLEYQP